MSHLGEGCRKHSRQKGRPRAEAGRGWQVQEVAGAVWTECRGMVAGGGSGNGGTIREWDAARQQKGALAGSPQSEGQDGLALAKEGSSCRQGSGRITVFGKAFGFITRV